MKIWYHRKSSQYKSTSDATATQGGEVYPGEGVYEDPDGIAATTTPGELKLTECPAYVTTTGMQLSTAKHWSSAPEWILWVVNDICNNIQ